MTGMAYLAKLVPEGVRTSDRRFIRPGALTWRDPAPLMYTDTTSDGHDGAVFVGNLTNFRRTTIDGDTWIVADVEWDTDDTAMEARRLVDESKLQGISADIGDVTANLDILETDADGFPTDWLETIEAGELLGGTQVAMPAFAKAQITLVSDVAPLTAAANPRADASWFTNPNLDQLTPLTVTDEGRIYGHLAPWGECHIGITDTCVTAPTSHASYKYFHTGTIHVDGDAIPVGHITIGTGHAPISLGRTATVDHYDNTGTVAADIVVGEDEHGIWVAGAARPNTDLHTLRSAALSGDWRNIGGNLELVATLAVNVPGFPVPHPQARVASGEPAALIAAGQVLPASKPSDLELVAQAIERLTWRIDDIRRPHLTDRALRLVNKITNTA